MSDTDDETRDAYERGVQDGINLAIERLTWWERWPRKLG